MLDRASEICHMIVDRIQQDFLRLERDFNATDGTRCCWIDNLLPQEILTAALSELPPLREMIRRKSLQERKYVSAQFDRLGAAGSLAVGFGRQEIADVVAMLLGKHRLDTDPKFYNGGLTIMVPGDFMCPHLDNSHNYERQQRRAVVLLYYMAPFWCANYGGSLELWDDDRSEPPRTVEYKPNRLVIMETTEHSWHAVQPVLDDWMMQQDIINVHPLTNTATVTLKPAGLAKFMSILGYKPQLTAL